LKNENCRELKYPDLRIFLIFQNFVGKNDLHIRVFAAFLGAGWGKQGGENSLDFKAIGGP